MTNLRQLSKVIGDEGPGTQVDTQTSTWGMAFTLFHHLAWSLSLFSLSF